MLRGHLSRTVMAVALASAGLVIGIGPGNVPVAAAFPTSSCHGTDACTGVTGTVGRNSCNGDRACYGAESVGRNSCNATGACELAGVVGNDSCNGNVGVCYERPTVGDHSCSGIQGCYSAGVIGDNSCHGDYACTFAGSVGNYSCNGDSACLSLPEVGTCERNASDPPKCSVQPDARIKVGSGALIGNNIYNADATDQAVTGAAARGSTITFTLSIQNDGPARDAFWVAAAGANASGYRVKYFHGTTNITSGVVRGAYTTAPVAPGRTFVIKVKVKVLWTAPRGSSITQLVTVVSNTNVNLVDAVSLTGKRK